MAYDPIKFYELLYGHRPDKDTPPEYAIFNKIAVGLLAVAEHQGGLAVKHFSSITTKYGFVGEHHAYPFFVLGGDKDNWPTLPPRLKGALDVGLWCMRNLAVAMPNYTRHLTVPPLELEPFVERVLTDFAKWCDDDLRYAMLIGYMRLLGANMKAYARISPEAEDNNPVWLQADFEHRVFATPLAITNGDVAERLATFCTAS